MHIKEVAKLQEKKYRKEYGLFIIQGEKSVSEALAGGIVEHIYCTDSFAQAHTLPKQITSVVSIKDLERAGTFVTNADVLATARCSYELLAPAAYAGVLKSAGGRFVLVLDTIRDPGNLGTIIRIADWFGITSIVASEQTVDVYNPKVVAATMGSFHRVAVSYTNLEGFLKEANTSGLPIMGALLGGESLYTATLPQNGLLVMGSESHGIEKSLEKYLTHSLLIPRVGGAESLNVAVATGIIVNTLTERTQRG